MSTFEFGVPDDAERGGKRYILGSPGRGGDKRDHPPAPEKRDDLAGKADQKRGGGTAPRNLTSGMVKAEARMTGRVQRKEP